MPAEYRHADHSRDFEPTDNYAQLREQCPLHHEADHDPPFYVLSRFDDIVATLRQHDEWRNRDGPGVFYQDNGVLGTTDEPDHGRHRRVLRPAFVPPAIGRLEKRLTEITDELIDEFIDCGAGDFVELLAIPLPALAIAELLGIDHEDRHSFRQWSTHAVDALTGGDIERYHHAKQVLEDHVEAGVNHRASRQAAGEPLPDDVLGLLTSALLAGFIDRREVRHLGYQLLVAGHETTTSLLGTMLYRLVQRPDLMARLRADPSLIPATIEEALRFDSPVQGLFRTNAHEAVLHGTTIPAGSKMQLLFASANRDPSRFECPDEFRIDRDRAELGRHVAFGWGIHFCIGAPLARLETRVAFEQVLARMDGIELSGEPQRNDSFVLHGLVHLPIRWTRRAVPTEGDMMGAGDEDIKPGNEYVDSYEDVSVFALDDAREQALHAAQTECTFMWTTSEGDPVGVIMNYVLHDGRFWVTCTRRRKRVAAVEARPRVAIAVSSRGTDIGVSQAVTYKGDAIVHDSAEVKQWFYPALAARVRPESTERQEAFVHHLDTQGRVVIEIRPTARIGFDAENMFKSSPAGPSRTKV